MIPRKEETVRSIVKEIGKSLKTIDAKKKQTEKHLQKEYDETLATLLKENQKTYKDIEIKSVLRIIQDLNEFRTNLLEEKKQKNYSDTRFEKILATKTAEFHQSFIATKTKLQKELDEKNTATYIACRSDLDKKLSVVSKDYQKKYNSLKKELSTKTHLKESAEQLEEEAKAFLNASSEILTTLDETIKNKAALLNKNKPDDVLTAYKEMEKIIYHTTNTLSQKMLLTHSHLLKLNLIFRLAPFTQYDLEKSEKYANTIISELKTQIAVKKDKFRFEKMTKQIEQDLLEMTPKGECNELFGKLHLAITNQCSAYTHDLTIFYSDLYYKKMQKFCNAIAPEINNQFLIQEKAQHQIQAQLVNFLHQHINPKYFHLDQVYRGIQDHLLMKNDKSARLWIFDNYKKDLFEHLNKQKQKAIKEGPSSCAHYVKYQTTELRRLSTFEEIMKIEDQAQRLAAFENYQQSEQEKITQKFDALYEQFFEKNEITPLVRQRINHAATKNIFFKQLTAGYMEHNPNQQRSLFNTKSLQTKDMLKELKGNGKKPVYDIYVTKSSLFYPPKEMKPKSPSSTSTLTR